MKKLMLAVTIVMLFSCNAYKAINVHELSMGMSKSQVFSIIIREPILEYSSNTYEAYRVKKRIVRGGIAEYQQYFLYFKNGLLFKIDKGVKAVDFRIRKDIYNN